MTMVVLCGMGAKGGRMRSWQVAQEECHDG